MTEQEYDLFIYAVSRLMPKGGWYFDGENVVVDDEGVSYGYTLPTQEEIDSAILAIKANEPKLAKLAELDAIVTRAKEDKAQELSLSLDAVEQAVVEEKIALRVELV